MSAEHTWVRHPETGGVWACPNEFLPVARARGWEKCDAPAPDESHLHDPVPPKKAAPVKKSGD